MKTKIMQAQMPHRTYRAYRHGKLAAAITAIGYYTYDARGLTCIQAYFFCGTNFFTKCSLKHAAVSFAKFKIMISGHALHNVYVML